MDVRNSTKRRGLSILGLFAVAVVFAGLAFLVWPWVWFFFKIATLPPLNWDVVSAKGSDCQLSDHRPIGNGAGLVAVLRDANCPGYFAQGTSYYVVFVHGIGERNCKENLVFQYTPGFKGYDISPDPTIVWREPARLKIEAPGIIERIMVQRETLSGVSMEYELGKVWPDATDGTVR